MPTGYTRAAEGTMHGDRPPKPSEIDPLAAEILEELSGRPESAEIVLGGYFAMRHYLDYRHTHDIDAWWKTGRKEDTLECIRHAMQTVADRHRLELQVREWGETVSFELREKKKVFSFQIAVRSRELEPARPSSWDPILIESLADNVGAKMNALVQRGAARDFIDIKELVSRGIVTVDQCWRWWQQKNPGGDIQQAKAHALRHLEALEQRRPLSEIARPEERAIAQQAREWLRRCLLMNDAPRQTLPM
jgi:hypothetical protein